jgi:hypothetical protein
MTSRAAARTSEAIHLAGVVQRGLDQAAHLLPEQPPIRFFVHHNTLHAFEDQHFDDAVLEASKRLGTEAYPSEAFFSSAFQDGKILPRDIEAELRAFDVSETPIFPGGPTLREFQFIRLSHLFEVPSGAGLTWLLDETDVLTKVHPGVSNEARTSLLGSNHNEPEVLKSLWTLLACHALPPGIPRASKRPRDKLLRAHGIDTDEWVNPFLIRVCAAFVDQGISYWPMPLKNAGLLESFRRLYGRRLGPPDAWLKGLGRELSRQSKERWSEEETIVHLLKQTDSPEDVWGSVIDASLLALPGWAGMIRQLELRPDRAPVHAPSAKLA